MSEKKTTEEFIEESKLIHGNRYDYSLVEYMNNHTKVKIICRKHGIFEQIPKTHIKGYDCLKCKYDKMRFDEMDFIEKSKKIHNNKYDYSLVEYVNFKTKIKIICPVHGIFEQRSSSHLGGDNCRECENDKIRKDIKLFIDKSNKKHKYKYDYSLVKYINCGKKVKIICPEHGVFEQTPSNHYVGGCDKCGKNKLKMTQPEFLSSSKEIHGDRYDYSLVEYVLSNKKVKIICKKHGIFEQRPNSHISKKNGCWLCFLDKNKSNSIEFIEKSKEIHGDRYDYSLVDYINSYTKVKIICKEHGIFEQSPDSHTRSKTNCPNCSSKSGGELKIYEFLKNKNIDFCTQKTFDDCKNKIRLRFDFYLPYYNLCVEYDGKQHNENVEYWGGEAGLNYRINNDLIKTNYCDVNKINLVRIKHDENIDEKLVKLFQK